MKKIIVMLVVLFVYGVAAADLIISSDHEINYTINEGVHVLDRAQVDLVTNGQINGFFHVGGQAQIEINGGRVTGQASASDDAYMSISSGVIESSCRAYNSGDMVITGGTINGDLIAHHVGSIRMYGGELGGAIYAGGDSKPDYAVITFVGSNFSIDGEAVSYGKYYKEDYSNGRLTGILNNGNEINNNFYIYDSASIVFIPEPCTFLLLGLGGVLISRRYPCRSQ